MRSPRIKAGAVRGKRINGPYLRYRKWRLVVADPAGSTTLAFESEDEARRVRVAMEQAARDEIAAGVVDEIATALLSSAVPLPRTPAWLYFLHDASGAIVYVGVTGSLKYRIRKHRENGVAFVRASWIPTAYERSFAMLLEATMIRMIDPPLNRTFRRPPIGNANSAGVSDEGVSEKP